MNDYTDDDFAAMALAVWVREVTLQYIREGEEVPHGESDHFPLEEWLDKLEDFKKRAAHSFSLQHDDRSIGCTSFSDSERYCEARAQRGRGAPRLHTFLTRPGARGAADALRGR